VAFSEFNKYKLMNTVDIILKVIFFPISVFIFHPYIDTCHWCHIGVGNHMYKYFETNI
jgi:hypothetical protein